MLQANRHHGDAFSQAVTSKEDTRGMDATTQASSPKDQQAQAYRVHKAWQNLGLERKIWT